MSQSNLTESPSVAFQLKGSLFTLTVLQLMQADMTAFSTQLAAMIQQAPKFFKNAPIVIDLQKLGDPQQQIDFKAIVQELRSHSLIPVGVRNGNTTQQTLAVEANLAILPEAKTEIHNTNSTTTVAQPKTTTPKTLTAQPGTKVITQQVRSGQQVYAKGGDLIVLAAVSPGAELLADGHIHIYGPLRGRALAGISGNQQARIFCHSLEAELVSIAGHYWVKDDLHTTAGQAVQIYLAEDRLHISEFN